MNMLFLLKNLSLVCLLICSNNQVLFARQTLWGRERNPSVLAISNISTASPWVPARSMSSISASQSVFDNHSRKVNAATCAIKDKYCNDNNGTIGKATATNLNDSCILWDPSCSGNRTLAMDDFFNQTFQNDLVSNECFAQLSPVNSALVSNCDKYNPPGRMSEFEEMKNWMRSQQCVSAAADWAARTPGNSNFTYANAKDWRDLQQDPDSQMADRMDPHPINYTSGVTPSCCGVCNINAQNVDLYYWPEPDADTSCLSIIGGNIRPLDYGATTTEYSIDPTSTSTAIYWGCNPLTSTYYNPMVTGNVTYTSAITTAQITAVGSLLVKVPLVNPWSPNPCLETGVPSRGPNVSNEIHDKHVRMHARDHTLIIATSITSEGHSAVSTVVSGNFTL